MRTLKKTISIFLLFLLMLTTNLFAQDLTTRGKEFWVSFGNNYRQPTTNITLQIKIAVNEATTVNFEFTDNPALNVMGIDLAAESVYTLDLSPEQKIAVYSNATGTTNKSIHITSDQDVSVYALNQSLNTADATCVLPVSNYGTDYYHISYKPSSGYWDGYTIVAIRNNTNIYLDGSATPQATLNAGQVYSYYWNSSTIDGTGTHITSDGPIAYFVTNEINRVPEGVDARDHLYEQLPPVNQWGTNFLVPQTLQEIGRVRIMASQANTTIKQSGATSTVDINATATVTSPSATYVLANPGDFIELEFKTAGCYISADKPIGVTAYMVGNTYTTVGTSPSDRGDPGLAWIPPVEQNLKEVLITPFIPSGTSTLVTHHALIVTPTLTKNQTTVSIGGAVPQTLGISWTDNPISGYSFGSLQLTQNSTYLFANPKGIVISGYGIGNIESYYYVAGSASRDLSAYFTVNDYYYTEVNDGVLCTPFDFKAFVNFDVDPNSDLEWIIDGVPQPNLLNAYEWNWETDANTKPSLGVHEIQMKVTEVKPNGIDTEEHTYTTRFEVVETMSIVWTPDNNTSEEVSDLQDWHNPDNWTTSNGLHIVPTRCADVYIPGDCNWYPNLAHAAECNNIYFLQGAELGHPHWLVFYKQARVQLNFGLDQYPQVSDRDSTLVIEGNDTFDRLKFSSARSPKLEREQWHLLSSPLQNVVSGDYGFGGFPLTYMQKFGPISTQTTHDGNTMNYIVGEWTDTYTEMSEPLAVTEGFAFYMYGFGWNSSDPADPTNRGTLESGLVSDMNDLDYFPERTGGNYGLKNLNGILELPFFEDSLLLISHRSQKYENGKSTFYHIGDANYGANPPSLYNYLTDKTDEVLRDIEGNYRFIAEAYKMGQWVFRDTVVHSGVGLAPSTEFLAGNPYMSSIDMVEFYKDNQDWLEPQFRVWDGATFVSYDIDMTGLGSVTPDDGSDPIAGRYVAPMQSFFLLTKPDYSNQDIIFDVRRISTVRPANSASNLRSNNSKEENVLRIEARNAQYRSSTLISGNKKEAISGYQNGEDIYKLFSQYQEVPEIYTLADNTPTAMNFVNNETEVIVPIGIKTNQIGKITLRLSGMDLYSKASKIDFIDSTTGTTIDITGESSFEYVFHNLHQGIQNGRFFIQFYPTQTGIENPINEQIEVYRTNTGITVTAHSPILKITIYDLQGRKLYENNSINTNLYTVEEDLDTEILILNVQTEEGVKNVKLMK